MSALTVIAALVVLFATCEGSPVPESPSSSTTTESEISNEIGGETPENPPTPALPGLKRPLKPPTIKSANHEVVPTRTTATHTTAHFKISPSPEHTTHKTSPILEHTTHKISQATKRPTQDFKVKAGKRCSRKKKDHVFRIHVGTGQVVFFSGACGPEGCVVKKELINGVIKPGTK